MSGRLRARVISRAQKVGGGANIREVKCEEEVRVGGSNQQRASPLPSYLLQFS